MKTETEIKQRLKEAKATYEDHRKALRIATGRVAGDQEFRKVVINHMLQLIVEIELLEWVLPAQPAAAQGGE